MPPGRRPLCAELAIAVTALTALAPAAARANETVTVQLTIPEKIEEPTVQHVAYVDRIANPILRVRPYDPVAECVVVLEGGPAAEGSAVAPGQPVVLELGAASFRVPVLPVIAGTTVDIKNVGKNTHPIYSPDLPELEGPPIGPGGVRTILLKDAGKAFRLLSKDSPHVGGHIVVLPNKYFARASRDGRFRVADVPPGKWTVRVWFRDVLLPGTVAIEVGPKLKPVSFPLPERLVSPPATPPAPAPAPAGEPTPK